MPVAKGVASPLSRAEKRNLHDDLKEVPEVKALNRRRRRALTNLVAEALAYREAGKTALHLSHLPNKKRGRPHQSFKGHFLNDIVNAWRRVTGQTVQVWLNEASGQKSVTMAIADAALSGRDWERTSVLRYHARAASAIRKKA